MCYFFNVPYFKEQDEMQQRIYKVTTQDLLIKTQENRYSSTLKTNPIIIMINKF